MCFVLVFGGMLGLGWVGPAVAAGEGYWVGDGDVSLEAGEGFSDIAGAGVHRSNVETLASRGILEGTECAPGQFCPEEPIERWVMAVWLVRSVDQGDPEVVVSSRFVDVEGGEWWVPFVERLADLGLTRGCALEPARFCPNEPVTRQQMASFLVRAFGLEPVSGNGFVDVEEGNSHLADINALAAGGITAGCATNPDRYCPTRETTRAEMATFLARALGIDSLPPPKGDFTAIATGGGHTCGVRTNGAIACWGQNDNGETDPPSGEFIAVAAG